jgi:hypothetical protein
MLGIGNLCIGVENYPDYHARRMIDLLLAGLAQATPGPASSDPLSAGAARTAARNPAGAS